MTTLEPKIAKSWARQRWVRALAAASGVSALANAGCGGGSSNAPAPDSGSSAVTDAATPEAGPDVTAGMTVDAASDAARTSEDAAQTSTDATADAGAAKDASGDGSIGPPLGSPQFPNLLSGYAVRPPWMVAGVDYAVGVPAGTALKDPSTINSPGVTVNPSRHYVEVNASNPVTIDGFDFSADGGWQIIIESDDVTVTSCNFAIGSNRNPMVNQVNASNSVFTYDTFNGNSLADTLNNVVFNLSGGATIEYSLVENSPSDDVDYGDSNTIKYNVFSNNGQLAGAHPDWLQLGNGVLTNQTVEYNTYIQERGSSQGIGLYAGTPGSYSMTTATVSNNTIVTGNGQPNYVFCVGLSGQVTGGGTGGLTGTATIEDNYVDPRGVNTAVFESIGTLQPGATYAVSGNINMVTGAALAP